MLIYRIPIVRSFPSRNQSLEVAKNRQAGKFNSPQSFVPYGISYRKILIMSPLEAHTLNNKLALKSPAVKGK